MIPRILPVIILAQLAVWVAPGRCQPPAAAPVDPHELAGRIAVGGADRTYQLHVPPGYDGKTPVPLVLVFHGAGGTGAGMEFVTGFNALSDRENVLAVYPDGRNTIWAGTPFSSPGATADLAFITALLDKLSHDYKVDATRVYAAGLSNGGMFAQRLFCAMPNRIAAVASVSGAITADFIEACRPGRALPILLIHGTGDPVVPYAGGEFGMGRLPAMGIHIRFVPAETTAKHWVDWDHCETQPVRSDLPDTDPRDGTRTRCATYGNGRDGSEVVFYTVEGGGHTWPGGTQYMGEEFIGRTSHDFDANSVIWTFFSRHRLAAAGAVEK